MLVLVMARYRCAGDGRGAVTVVGGRSTAVVDDGADDATVVIPTAVPVTALLLPLLMVVAITWSGTRDPPLQHAKSNPHRSIDGTRVATSSRADFSRPSDDRALILSRQSSAQIVRRVFTRKILFPGTGCPPPTPLLCPGPPTWVCFANFRASINGRQTRGSRHHNGFASPNPSDPNTKRKTRML